MSTRRNENRIIKGAIRGWYRWHRRIGIIAAFFVIILSVTGIILNHNASLNLHKQFITAPWLLSWYGYEPDADYAQEILTVDKIILDLHTGRFFGAFGSLVMDGAAIALLLLSVTGIYMWYRRQNPNKKKRK